MFERRSIYRETAKDYQKACKKDKTAILDRFIRTTGLKNRIYAATLLRLHGKTIRLGKKDFVRSDIDRKGKRTGRKKKYEVEVLDIIIQVWIIENYICRKRLRPILNEVLGNLIKNGHLKASAESLEKLSSINASSIDRLLKKKRGRLEINGLKGTKPGTLLKQHIAIRSWADWDEKMPGFMEIDPVSHEGGNSRGDFAQTLNIVDVLIGWIEPVVIKNKATKWVKEAIEKVRIRLPFDLLGIDSDAGSEFINRPMRDWCRETGT